MNSLYADLRANRNAKPCECGHPKNTHRGERHMGACKDTRCDCPGYIERERAA